MSRLSWGTVGDRYFETGVDHGVLYVDGEDGVAWNGLISVAEAPSGGTTTPYYLDGVKFLNLVAVEEYAATIQAFSSPPEFDACDGNASMYDGLFFANQPRKPFGFSYRTQVGNDVDGQDHGYKLHLIYNALAAPTSSNNATVNASTDPIQFSWAITATPILIGVGYAPTAHLVIDSRLAKAKTLSDIEAVLYGSDTKQPALPTLTQVMTIYDGQALTVTILPDHSYSAEGTSVTLLGNGYPEVFVIDNKRVTELGKGTLFSVL